MEIAGVGFLFTCWFVSEVSLVRCRKKKKKTEIKQAGERERELGHEPTFLVYVVLNM